MSNHSQPATGRSTSPSTVLLIVSAAVVLASLDLFIVNVALPDMAADFGEKGLGDLSWVLNAYAIVYAALLVFFGRLADRFPRERGFLVGLAVFVLGSALCAIAGSTLELVAFRVIQATGAALLTPTSLGLVLATAPPEHRERSVRAWAAIGGLAAALGPVIGGVLVEASWRWVFVVNVPIGLAALVAAVRLLPHVPGQRVQRPDALGVVLVTGGVAAVVLGLVKGEDWGWASTDTLVALVAGTAALLAFAAHCARARNPLIGRELFAHRAFTGASVVMVLLSAAFGAMLLSMVLWMQGAWGFSPLETGLAISPGPLMVPFFGFFVAGRLIPRIGAGAVIAIGSLAFAGGAIWWSLAIGSEADYAGEMLGGALLTGVGVGFYLPTTMAAASAALPPTGFATGSAVVNMLRQVGLAVGVAVLIAVLGTPATDAARLDAFHTAWLVLAGFALAGGVAAVALLVAGPARSPSPVPATATEEPS